MRVCRCVAHPNSLLTYDHYPPQAPNPSNALPRRTADFAFVECMHGLEPLGLVTLVFACHAVYCSYYDCYVFPPSSISDQCAEYKHLHGGVEFVSSIPKSDNGKYLRRALRDSFIEKHMP